MQKIMFIAISSDVIRITCNNVNQDIDILPIEGTVRCKSEYAYCALGT